MGALEDACKVRKFQPGRLEKLDRAGLLGGSSLSLDGDDNDDDDMGEDLDVDDITASNRGRGVVITRAGGMDPAIMTALRVLVSSDTEWEASGQAVGNFVTENSGGKENERLARIVAQKAIQLELDSKPTTLEEDEELLKKMMDGSELSTSAEQLAVQFRM